MQAINRIQNATINANATGILGATVVTGANAHRAYPSFKPCDLSPVVKRPVKRSRSLSPAVISTESSNGLGLCECGLLLNGPVGRSWQHDSHQQMMPPTLWATMVLNRRMCG